MATEQVRLIFCVNHELAFSLYRVVLVVSDQVWVICASILVEKLILNFAAKIFVEVLVALRVSRIYIAQSLNEVEELKSLCRKVRHLIKYIWEDAA